MKIAVRSLKYKVECPTCLKTRFVCYTHNWKIIKKEITARCFSCSKRGRPKGVIFSDEHKRKLKEARKRQKPTYGMLGKHHSEESKRKISRPREKNWRWIPDRSLLKKKNERNDVAYKEWRNLVWTRDRWKCRISDSSCCGRIEAHHILGWKEHPELRYQLNNGITLCHAHHPRKREDEAKLSPYFKKLVAEKN